MDDQRIRIEANRVAGNSLDKRTWNEVDIAEAGIRRGIELHREHTRQLDTQIDAEIRKDRRDRFAAAALTGFISACDDFDARHFDDSVCARSSIEMADAVLSLLDSESSETSETFERESEGKL